MIQRIQSLYLLLAAIGQVVFATGTYFTYNLSNSIYKVTGKGVFDMNEMLVGGDSKSFYLGLVLALFAFVTIFLFKNRKRQIKFSKIGGLATFAEIIFLLVTFYKLNQGEETNISFGFALFIVPITTVLFFMANKAVKKDDDLVRSVDRIR
tara:strand:+ start:9198 stop:9650 length:453 start_codon:yes stop_codon:yes gene_type:complete